MNLLILSLAILIATGFISFVFRLAKIGVLGVVSGGLIGLIPAIEVLLTGKPQSLYSVWDVPYASFFIGIDSLSSFFLILILVVSILTAIYGGKYLGLVDRQDACPSHWFFFNILIASMIMVVVAKNGVLFLIAWEMMSLSSFFLVTFEDEKKDVCRAGWIYLIASHAGTACLLALFILLGQGIGIFDFDCFKTGVSPDILFLLAIVGFGTKAGFVPFHIWLPEAHPAAPSHVSALMSGVMIKMGIYGILRILTLLGTPPIWWGWLLVSIGIISGIWGAILALSQHDIKRLLAYSSVENIGIIAMGLGLGLIGWSIGSPYLAVLGFAGGLLHVVNHSLFKGLLFLCAGSVIHATGTRDIERLGGLMKRMPWTGVTFLVGAIAICGLPPLNGFISEFLIYLWAFKAGITTTSGGAISGICVIAALALIGGLAAVCFTRVFGIVFLGEPRSSHTSHSHDPALSMRIPMVILAVLCFLAAIFSPVIVRAMCPIISMISSLPVGIVHENVISLARILQLIVATGILLLLLIGIWAAFRKLLFANRRVETGLTWDCGYVKPTPRMQYTASGFVQPITGVLWFIFQTKKGLKKPQGIFPKEASLATQTTNVFTETIYKPVFTLIQQGLSGLKWIQHGYIQSYILYITLTLIILLVWKVR
ncbi:MAG: proton-conducting transporter membrane subunit [Candidatus Desantisbacteria bacterium]